MLGRNRILVVDDDRDVVRGARLRLGAAGYDTLVAFDGEEGVAMAVNRHPDAILLDIRMPRKNGLMALAELRAHQQTKNIPIVMLSACLLDQQASLDAGARFFLAKPYQARKLLEVIESALDERTAARASRSAPVSSPFA